jgi:hypothetical protein
MARLQKSQNRQIPLVSLIDFRLDKLGEVLERILPAKIARLQGNHVGQAFLYDVQLSTDRHRPERHRNVNFPR